MPLPTPNSGETRREFMRRCSRDDEVQRLAEESEGDTGEVIGGICASQWEKGQDRSLEAGPHYRSMEIDLEGRAADDDTRDVSIAFSSEAPVERFFGAEILDHGPGSVKMSRLRSQGAVLFNHDPDRIVGSIRSVSIGDDRVARARIRFDDTPEGNLRRQQVLVDKSLRGVSVGYRLTKDPVVEERDSDGRATAFRFKGWEPFELTLTPIPEDASVGVGRSQGAGGPPGEGSGAGQYVTLPNETEGIDMLRINTPRVQDPEPGTGGAPAAPASTTSHVVVTQADPAELERARTEARSEGERRAAERVQAMLVIGRDNDALDLASEYIEQGRSVQDLQNAIMERYRSGAHVRQASHIGMEQGEVEQWSLFRAVRAHVDGNWDKAGLELQASLAVAEAVGREARGFFVPMDVQQQWLDRRTLLTLPAFRGVSPLEAFRRDLTTTDDGATFVQTDLLAANFIDALRATSVTTQLGATTLPGLVGQVDIGSLEGPVPFAWVAEDTGATPTDPPLGTRNLVFRTLAGAVGMSRQLMHQSTPSVEQVMRRDMVIGAALGVDNAAINADGTGAQPTGIRNTVGVLTQTIADAGNVPTWAEVVGFETQVETANALAGNLAYSTHPSQRGNMKTTSKDTGSGQFIWDGNEVNGYRALSSTQHPVDGIIFGDWSACFIGFWGTLDLMNDRATKVASGGLVLRAFMDADVAVRHPVAFCIDA